MLFIGWLAYKVQCLHTPLLLWRVSFHAAAEVMAPDDRIFQSLAPSRFRSVRFQNAAQ